LDGKIFEENGSEKTQSGKLYWEKDAPEFLK
jgi:hypothetical protein